jgi:hypothetical protein
MVWPGLLDARASLPLCGPGPPYPAPRFMIGGLALCVPSDRPWDAGFRTRDTAIHKRLGACCSSVPRLSWISPIHTYIHLVAYFFLFSIEKCSPYFIVLCCAPPRHCTFAMPRGRTAGTAYGNDAGRQPGARGEYYNRPRDWERGGDDRKRKPRSRERGEDAKRRKKRSPERKKRKKRTKQRGKGKGTGAGGLPRGEGSTVR